MDTKHQIVINIIDHQNQNLLVMPDLPKDCNLMTAITALRTAEALIRDELDRYARNRGFASSKEMPRNFRNVLKLVDILGMDEPQAIQPDDELTDNVRKIR